MPTPTDHLPDQAEQTAAQVPAEPSSLIHSRPRPLWIRDDGSAATELVVLAPLLVLVLLVVVGLGRMADARLRVDDAAHQAARAASLARNPGQARQQAGSAAGAALAAYGPSCSHFAVQSGTGPWTPGGVVRVTVTCSVDLGITGMPAHITVKRTAVSVIDLHRGAPG